MRRYPFEMTTVYVYGYPFEMPQAFAAKALNPDSLSEHPGKSATGQVPARAEHQGERTATQLLHLAAQRMSEEEQALLIDKLRKLGLSRWTAQAILSTLLPGPEEEGDD